MSSDATIDQTDISELKSQIIGLRRDIQRFLGGAESRKTEDALENIRADYAGLFVDHQITTADRGLREGMTPGCPMRDDCFTLFLEFLENTAQHIQNGEVSDAVIQSYRHQLRDLEREQTLDGCSTCFAETNRLFEKQIDLMQSLGIYHRQRERGDAPPIPDLPEETLVEEVFEPVANLHRFRIIKALSSGSWSFSELSTLTGLRGGNLLFHLKKLQDSGMILQVQDRGDYVITGRGYSLLEGICRLYAALRE